MNKLIVLIAFVILSTACTTIKTVREVQTVKVIDTVLVYVPERIDTLRDVDVNEFEEIGLVFSSVVIDSSAGRIDTVIVVEYYSDDTSFVIQTYPDSIFVETVRVDTVAIITNLEEPTMLEQWWWLPVAILVLVLLIIVVIKFK